MQDTQKIGNYAFAGHSGVSGSFVGNTVVATKTGDTNNKNGITVITLPNTVKKISGYAFQYTAITKFVMPDSVTEIGGGLFEGCKVLTEVHLSDGIEMIPGSLGYPKNLKKINLPKNLKYIAVGAFRGFGELSELVIPQNSLRLSLLLRSDWGFFFTSEI